MKISTLFRIIPEPFGFDLSDRTIKVAQLSKKTGGLVLENFGEVDIDRDVLVDGVVVSEDKLVEAIQEGLLELRKGSMSTKYVACSLPEQKTYLRVVQLPKMKPEEIQEAIQWEIEANVPIGLEEAYFDWELIPENRTEKVDHIDILVSVAPRELVDSYTGVLLKAGLKPFSFEPESVALARSVVRQGASSGPTMLVDFGQTRTSFIIYAGGSLRFTSSIVISGNGVTDVIARSLKVSFDEAEKLKKEVGMDPDKDARVFEAIVPAMADLKDQINTYRAFYLDHSSHIHSSDDKKIGISKVLLTGGGASLKGIEKYLSLTLNIPVEVGNPWINILGAKTHNLPELKYKESIRYTTALGLALGQL